MSNFESIPLDFSAIFNLFKMISLKLMNIQINLFSYPTIRFEYYLAALLLISSLLL